MERSHPVGAAECVSDRGHAKEPHCTIPSATSRLAFLRFGVRSRL